MRGRADMEGVAEDTVGDDGNAAFDTPFTIVPQGSMAGRNETSWIITVKDWSGNLN